MFEVLWIIYAVLVVVVSTGPLWVGKVGPMNLYLMNFLSKFKKRDNRYVVDIEISSKKRETPVRYGTYRYPIQYTVVVTLPGVNGNDPVTLRDSDDVRDEATAWRIASARAKELIEQHRKANVPTKKKTFTL